METSPLIWRASQWTDFYMIETSIIKELRKALLLFKNVQRYLLLNSNSLEKKMHLLQECIHALWKHLPI